MWVGFILSDERDILLVLLGPLRGARGGRFPSEGMGAPPSQGKTMGLPTGTHREGCAHLSGWDLIVSSAG